MSKGKLLIFGVLAVILSGFSLFFINKQHQPSYDDFTKVIIKEYPALERDNKPVFSIVSTKRYGLKWQRAHKSIFHYRHSNSYLLQRRL